jgi:acetyl-CoA carboxylase carboxyltransferase component
MKFKDQIEEYKQRTEKAMSMGGEEKLQKRKDAKIMNARERVDYLLDENSFLESGRFTTSTRADMKHKTPADGKIAGFGRIDQRDVGIVSNDFTVAGASSSSINSKKMEHIKKTTRKRGMPLVFLGESTGARMPDVMGATGIGGGNNPIQYLRMRETPWVSAVLGHCYGSSAWYTALSDFTVMRKGAILAVSSPGLASLATREEVEPEALGGWKLHTEVTGLIDLAVNTDEEALDAIRTFLSYLPSHHQEAPPIKPASEGADEDLPNMLDLIPDSKKQVYDVRKVIKATVDQGSFFELKKRFGKPAVTALARLNGKSVGIIANNPMFKGGAIDADSCDKIVKFIVLCDSYNIPIIFMVDQPGFLIGIEAERKRMPGKVMNWMNALSLCTVPKISLILRKSYGQAVLNMGGAGNADEVIAWWSAEMGFMDPHSAVSIVYGISEKDDPQKFQEYLEKMSKDTSAYELASFLGAHSVIDPRETREYLIRTLEVHEMKLNNGVGEHLMRTWPTSF